MDDMKVQIPTKQNTTNTTIDTVEQ
jgi:hypothetical protein